MMLLMPEQYLSKNGRLRACLVPPMKSYSSDSQLFIDKMLALVVPLIWACPGFQLTNLKLILYHKSLLGSSMAWGKYCFTSTVIDLSFSFYFTSSRKQHVWKHMYERPNIHLHNATENLFAFCVLGRNL